MSSGGMTVAGHFAVAGDKKRRKMHLFRREVLADFLPLLGRLHS